MPSPQRLTRTFTQARIYNVRTYVGTLWVPRSYEQKNFPKNSKRREVLNRKVVAKDFAASYFKTILSADII